MLTFWRWENLLGGSVPLSNWLGTLVSRFAVVGYNYGSDWGCCSWDGPSNANRQPPTNKIDFPRHKVNSPALLWQNGWRILGQYDTSGSTWRWTVLTMRRSHPQITTAKAQWLGAPRDILSPPSPAEPLPWRDHRHLDCLWFQHISPCSRIHGSIALDISCKFYL